MIIESGFTLEEGIAVLEGCIVGSRALVGDATCVSEGEGVGLMPAWLDGCVRDSGCVEEAAIVFGILVGLSKA